MNNFTFEFARIVLNMMPYHRIRISSRFYVSNMLNKIRYTSLEFRHLRLYFIFLKERARAKALNYSDPVNPNYDATTEMYHNTLTECLGRVQKLKEKGDVANKVSIMVASHNEDTVRFALAK